MSALHWAHDLTYEEEITLLDGLGLLIDAADYIGSPKAEDIMSLYQRIAPRIVVGDEEEDTYLMGE